MVGCFRAGVEWVGQDLEETFGDEAEGGARQFIGPTAALQLLQDRLTIVAGPSVGLSSRIAERAGPVGSGVRVLRAEYKENRQ